MRCALAAIAVLLAAGCNESPGRGAPSATANATGTATPARGAKVAPSRIRTAILDAGGVAIGANPGTARHFAFGASRVDVEAAADRFLAEPGVRSSLAECGAGPMDFTKYGKLTLDFQEGKLVGWLAGEEPHVVTSDGIRPGMLMRDLQVARSARMIAGSTLAGEFDYLAADGHVIRGFATGTGETAKIASLYAGLTCFFR